MSGGMLRRSGRIGWRLIGVIAALALVSIMLPGTTFAAAPVFGTPKATSSFGKGVDFTQPVTGLPSGGRIEIEIDYPKAIGPAVTEVEPSAGTLTYHLDTSQGQLVPNTKLVARWRVTQADGSATVGPDVHVTYADDRYQWKTKSSSLITLHWYQGDDAFASRALSIGEQGIEKAASYLGATGTKPVDFFVYAEQQPFYDALGPGTRENVGGEAHPDIRTLFALITPSQVNDSWVATVVPHELTHIVFDDVVSNPLHYPPHWLNEGVAVYLTQGYDSSDKADVASAAKAKTLMPLAALTGQFPTVGERFSLGYSESVSAVDYLVRTYGKSALVKLIGTFARGVSDDAAFKAATGLDAAAFDTAWLASNGVASVTKFGPQPAPSGAEPPGWNGNIASATGNPSGTAVAAVATDPGNGQEPGNTSSRQADRPPVLLALALLALAGGLLAAAFVLHRRSQGSGG